MRKHRKRSSHAGEKIVHSRLIYLLTDLGSLVGAIDYRIYTDTKLQPKDLLLLNRKSVNKIILEQEYTTTFYINHRSKNECQFFWWHACIRMRIYECKKREVHSFSLSIKKYRCGNKYEVLATLQKH